MTGVYSHAIASRSDDRIARVRRDVLGSTDWRGFDESNNRNQHDPADQRSATGCTKNRRRPSVWRIERCALVSGFLSRPLAKEINFTVSIGISEVVLAGDEADAVLKRADQALYRAKQSGRDRCEVG